MKVTSLLFSAPMINAMLDGRKDQTRRFAKLEPLEAGLNLQFSGLSVGHAVTDNPSSGFVLFSRGEGGCWSARTKPIHCPHGMPGDLIYVRETHFHPVQWSVPRGRWKTGGQAAIRYCADDAVEWRDVTYEVSRARQKLGRCPSIHMNRWRSRLTLRITEVRLERIRSIKDAEAKREGVLMHQCPQGYVAAFQNLWKDTYGAEQWDSNPWVWVISYEVIRQNVDNYLATLKAAA